MNAMRHALLALIALATAAAAHDFWIEPTTFRPQVGKRVDVQLLVGERFVGEPVTRKDERILSFVAVDARGDETKVLGVEGRAPAGLWKPASPGLHVLAYRSNGVAIELEAAKFEAYLAEEGLESVIAERKRRGESARTGRELYARCAKSLVVVAGAEDARPADLVGWDRALGLPLEIVPLADPTTLAADAPLAVRVLHDGKPLPNALIGCMAKSDAAKEARVRTDAEGRATFAPTTGGAHLVRVVHMTRSQDGAAHEWESHWASLTFDLPARASSSKSASR